MPLILNIHTPSHSFALPYRENEKSHKLIDRILRKSGLEDKDREAIRGGKDGGRVEYEFEGGRWSLQDDDDLEIMLSRFPPSSTPSLTLHLTPPTSSIHPSSSTSNSLYLPPAPSSSHPNQHQPNGTNTSLSQGQGQGNNLLPRAPKSTFSTLSRTTRPKSVHPPTGSIRGYEEEGYVEGEDAWVRHQRKWKAFHEGRGVRTVVGKIGGVGGVRMLLKAGYRHVYVSRPFAIRSGLIPKTSSMGAYGYAGLVNLGQLPITVGSRTEKHTVMISEEVNFDVVLGRSWMEKMGIRTDPVDQTHVSYLDSGESIPCDIVVLKDEKGGVVTVT